jgi:type IV secretory pathway TrbD component
VSEFVTVLLPFIALGVLAVAEYFVARAWLPAYFRYGLPAFRTRVHGVRLDAQAEERIGRVADQRASLIVFQRLSESEIAFREKGRSSVSFRYTPILHGLLRYVPEEGATYVIGWLNLFALAATGFMGYIFFSASRWQRPWELTVWFALIFGVMYGIGVWRYRMVAKSLQATDATG